MLADPVLVELAGGAELHAAGLASGMALLVGLSFHHRLREWEPILP